jgi:hypothetical protein
VFAAGLVGEHAFMIEDAGALAADPPNNRGAVDDKKLRDILLYVEYRLPSKG